MRRRRGFTLVELIVVIGVIALLMSLLLPALSKARESANAVKCASNLHQLAMTWTMYAQQQRGISAPGLPPVLPAPSTNLYWVGNGEQYRPRWYGLCGGVAMISPFAHPSPSRPSMNTMRISNPVFLCPS